MEELFILMNIIYSEAKNKKRNTPSDFLNTFSQCCVDNLLTEDNTPNYENIKVLKKCYPECTVTIMTDSETYASYIDTPIGRIFFKK